MQKFQKDFLNKNKPKVIDLLQKNQFRFLLVNGYDINAEKRPPNSQSWSANLVKTRVLLSTINNFSKIVRNNLN